LFGSMTVKGNPVWPCTIPLSCQPPSNVRSAKRD
jgi:hypothetical protein